jgi:hypothetical protein
MRHGFDDIMQGVTAMIFTYLHSSSARPQRLEYLLRLGQSSEQTYTKDPDRDKGLPYFRDQHT